MTANQHRAICQLCGGTIPAWAGTYTEVYDARVIRHLPGACPGVRAEVVAHPLTDTTGRAEAGWDLGEVVEHRGELLVVEQTWTVTDTIDGDPVRVHGAALRTPTIWEMARLREEVITP